MNIFEKGFLGGSQKAFFIWALSASRQAKRFRPFLGVFACPDTLCMVDMIFPTAYARPP